MPTVKLPAVKTSTVKASTVQILNRHFSDVRLNVENIQLGLVTDTFVIPVGLSTQDANQWSIWISTHPDSPLLTSGTLMVC
jgi:hypothetical protein